MAVYNARNLLDLACEVSMSRPEDAWHWACQAYVLATDATTKTAALALMEAL